MLVWCTDLNCLLVPLPKFWMNHNLHNLHTDGEVSLNFDRTNWFVEWLPDGEVSLNFDRTNWFVEWLFAKFPTVNTKHN